MKWVLIILILITLIAVLDAIVDQATCEYGHTVTERQAKGNFNHFVCDRRRP